MVSTSFCLRLLAGQVSGDPATKHRGYFLIKPLVDDEDLQRKNPEWQPSEWISCGRLYQDLPLHVATEVARARRMPAEMEATLPSLQYSPAGFHMHASLPEWKPSCDKHEEDISDFAVVAFDETQPTYTASVLAEVPLLSQATITRLENGFGQAFLDGKLSVRDARDENNIHDSGRFPGEI
ncbi:hypothetical protein GGX14DRAFT_404998 [Mycena pura]|uniref:Uncharacterized protein n=1 Tax=Mycena pura TaxID=153505 RepID=A0AAD6UWX9_9AGAR|nr:hypothetical protein GGX14DRAFT_404998 [Mycena pura]